jgi:hypothetical protein
MTSNVELISRSAEVNVSSDDFVNSRVLNSTALDPTSHHGFSLPPADTGKEAWYFLATCFLVEAVVWGEYRSEQQLSESRA